MEKTNWIKKITEFIRVAMNKGLKIKYDSDKIKIWTDKALPSYIIELNWPQISSLKTPKGYVNIDYILTDRENLELQALCLSIKEYQEDMAISEFEEFISGKNEEKIVNINDLDDDDNDKE